MDAGRKKRWREGENILTGLKCRKSGKQEKMPTLGKGTFFYRTSRKEGNKGNKNGGEKKKEGKDAEKTTEGKIIRRHGDAPMVAGCSPKMTGFFNSNPFKTAGRTKRNGRNGFLEIHCLTDQLYPKKHQTKNRNQHLTHALAFQSKHQGE